MVLLFSPSIYRFPGCLYCISKNLRTARRLLGEYIPIGDEPKRTLTATERSAMPKTIYNRGSTMPCWAWYFPFLSLYETSHSSSETKKTTWQSPSSA